MSIYIYIYIYVQLVYTPICTEIERERERERERNMCISDLLLLQIYLMSNKQVTGFRKNYRMGVDGRHDLRFAAPDTGLLLRDLN